MKIRFSRNAAKGLDKIFGHVRENFSDQIAIGILGRISERLHALETFPNLGRPIAGHPLRRQLTILGNVFLYEIVIARNPYILVRNIVPRKTEPM